jgi:hypothetical protein
VVLGPWPLGEGQGHPTESQFRDAVETPLEPWSYNGGWRRHWIADVRKWIVHRIPQVEVQAEFKGRSGTEILIEVLNHAESFQFALPPRRYQISMSLALKKLRRHAPAQPEITRIVASLLETAKLYEYSGGSFGPWYDKMLQKLPIVVRDAAISAVAELGAPGTTDIRVVALIGGARSKAFFESRRKQRIDHAKDSHPDDWAVLEQKLRQLPIVALPQVRAYLTRVAEVTTAARLVVSGAEDILADAVMYTSYNRGSFAELVERSTLQQKPFQHLEAKHTWSQGPIREGSGWGTKTFRAFRIEAEGFVCHDHVAYGGDRSWHDAHEGHHQ